MTTVPQPSKRPRLVYGPVPSRRLGRSLGVDLIPFKTCSYDCSYCQLGPTRTLSVERREYVPLDQVLHELRELLTNDISPDFIALAGSGEPTLYSRLGELIEGVRALSKLPIALISNGSMLGIEEVARAALMVDVLLPSLDAGNEASFRRVNRPHESIAYEEMLEGLVRASWAFRGEWWLELMLLQGVNDSAVSLRELASQVDRMRCDRIQLNTAVRVSSSADVAALDVAALQRARAVFGPRCEIIAASPKRPAALHQLIPVAVQEQVLALLQRRPCTVEELATGLALPPNALLKCVEALLEAGKIQALRHPDALRYRGRADDGE